MTTFKRFLTLSLMTVLTAVTIYSYAVPAYRGWQTKTQPDGSTITVRQMGDEFFHYWENEAGQQVAKDAEGWWRVQAQPATQSAVQKRKQASRRYNQNEPGKPAKVGGINLAPRGLVILVNFSDVTFRAANTQSAMSDLMNSTNYTYDNATGSVREFFKAQSGGAYVPDFDVVGPFNLDYNRAHYGANDASGDDVLPGDVIVEACQKADASGVDFTLYNNDGDTYVDFVYVIYAGEGEADSEVDDALWPMNWTLASARYFNNCSYTQEQSKFDGLYINNFAFSGELRGGTTTRCAIGTIAHEFGHVLGLPDYYVTSKTASNYNKKYTPGSWHIMDYGSYNNDGRTPPNYTPHDKYFFGWSTPTLLAKDEKKNCMLTTTYGSAYQITGGTTLKGATASDRVWYIEKRQKNGWDEYLPGHGMVAWEVTYNSSNWNSNAPNNSTVGYTVVTANNLTRPYTPYTTNDPSSGNCGTPFPGTSNITSWTPATGCALTEITESAGVITFKYNGGVVKTKSSYEFVTEHCTAPDDGEVDINDPLSVVITPASGYSLADASCWTVEMGGVALTYGTDFTYNPATNTFYIASLTDDVVILADAKAIRTVTWSVNGSTTTIPASTFADGAALVLPSTPSDCSGSGGKKFVGWTAHSSISGEPDDLFTEAGTKTVTVDITYYAVYATASGGGGSSVTYEFSITSSDFSGSSYATNNGEHTSTAYDVTDNTNTMSISWTSFNVSNQSGMQWKKSGSYIYNSTDLGKINSVTVSGDALTKYYGTTAEPTNTSLGTNDGYFKVTNNTSGALHTTSIAVNFTKSTGGGTTYSDYSLTCSAPEPCANQVTLSKGTPANGSFNISKTGAQDNCAAGGLVVNVTDITPAAGYEFGAITQTGIVSGVTIDQVAKTVTYAKDVTGTSTINVTFNPLPTYAIRFFNNGAQVGATQNLIAGAVAVKPSDPTPCMGDYTFVGWWTAALAEDNTTAETWVTDFTVSGAQDYYAVYSKTEGSGGSSNVVFNFGYTNDWGQSGSWSGTDKSSVTNTKDGVTVTHTRGTGSMYANTTATRFYKDNTLTFSVATGSITSIEFTCSTYQTDITSNVGTCTATGSEFSWSGDASSVSFTRPSGASGYAQFSAANITIGGGGTTYYTTSPSCVECTNKVTLTKGTPSNGSFTLDKADGEYDNCATGGLVVHVSDITPAAGYEFGAITQTGIDAGVTIDPVGKTVTYAKDVTGTSTINVTFNPLPTYAIRFFNNGVQVGATQNLIAGAVAVKPSDPTPCTGDYTFVGWWTATLAEDNTTAETWVTDFTVSGAQDYYAVYSQTVGGGGSSKTYTLELDGNNFAGSYAERSSSATANEDGGTGTLNVSFTSNGVMKSSNSGNPIQFRKSGSGAGVLYNTTDLGTINSITYGSGSTNNIASTYKGSTEQPTSDGTGGYFKITNGSSVSYITSITINFTKSTGGGGTTYYTTSPSCVECTNKVTLTKGAEEHGTFTLDKANGEYNNCTSNFVVTVSSITPASGYYCTGVTATGDHNEVTGPDGSGNYTVTYTKGNSITSIITANFAPNPTYSVTWSMNGDESTKDYYEEGESIVFPATADGCDGKTFMGWSAVQVPEQDDAPAYTTSATMGTSNLVYYAVYAEASGSGGTPTELLSENFSSITNGNNTSTSGSPTPWSGNSNIEYVSTVYQAGGAIRIGASGSGSIETIALSATAGSTLTVSFDVKGWTNVEGDIRVTVTGCTPQVISYTATMANDFENKSAEFTLVSDNPTVTIATTAKRAFIDNIVITSGGGTTYSGYTTTCGAGISAQNIGWITSAQGMTVKRVIPVSAKNFDDATTLTATCANSNFHLTLGESAVPAGTTGLTTTLTVEYTPTTESTVEANVDITLSAGDKTRTITVSGRSVPDDFLLITKKNDKWYALPANMTSGSGEYDGVEVSPNDATTPTAVPVSPSTLIYNLASVASSRYAANGNLVRLVGNNNKCLWGNKATGATKVNIQNYAALAESNGDNYEWDLKTTDGVHYFVESPCNDEYAEGRRLAYGTKFGMYKEETVFFIVRAGCSSQPGEIVVSPRRVDATFSWVSNTTQMHIDLYTNSEMTEGHLSATASSSPYVFTGLAESTDYWYKLTPGDDTDCAVTGTFKTTGPIIDIVEWKEDSVVLFIDKGDINPVIVIDGQEEHGSITGGGEATELFFAKYFEGAGAMKLLSIFNGTKNAISLSGYKFIDRHAGDNASIYGSDNEYDLSSLGSIEAGQEIIFFSRPVESQTKPLFDCSNDFLTTAATKNKTTDNPRWIECATGKFANKAITFNGNDALILKKGSDIIDVIGSLGTPGQDNNCNGEDAWAGTIKNMDYDAEHPNTPSDPAYAKFFEVSSLSPSSTADSLAILNAFGVNLSNPEINISTARCIFFRDKRVTSGDSAVLMNTGGEFKTFTTHIEGGQTYKAEWYGRSVCMTSANKTAAGVTNDAQATCNSYQDIANMDYNQYYIDWSNIDPGQTLDNFTSDPDTKEYTIPIDNMRQYACLKLRFQLKMGDEVLTEAAQQVPIVVVGDVDTNDPLFSELVIDKGTGDPSYSYSVERCKDCDVVVLGAASLTKGLDADPKDVPEVGNVKVYPGGQLIVPSGTEYTIKSLALRRQEDEIATANIQGTLTYKAPAAASPAPRHEAEADDAQRAKKTEPAPKQTFFDLRIDPTNWHFISLPYDVNVADIRFANPEETAIPVLGTDYLLKWYDGEKRAATKNDQTWEMVAPDATLKRGLGYIFALPGTGKVKREFRFPMSNDVITQENDNKFVESVYGYGCDQPTLGSNHKGWNLVGAPYLMPYSSDLESPLRTGMLIEDHSPEHDVPTWDGSWTDNGDGLYYIAIPINNGWDYYKQVTMEDYPLQPFTSYFVQIDGGLTNNPADPQGIDFNASRVQRSSIVRRRPAEYEETEDTHPVWCQIDLTNPQGETDKTTVLMSNRFTDNYDMMRDMTKMRGAYYNYYSRPVLASRNNEGEMAFNALPDSSALAGIPLNFFAAGSGSYTIAYNDRYGREEVKAVMLLDKTTNQWYDLMSEPYEFTTNRENNTTRFILSVRVERKQPQTPTDIFDPSAGADGQTPRKLLINGHVYILRGGVIYDMTGKPMLNL